MSFNAAYEGFNMIILESLAIDDVRLKSPWLDAAYGRLLLIKGESADESFRIGLKAVMLGGNGDIQVFVNCQNWSWSFLNSETPALDVSALVEVRVRNPVPKDPREEFGHVLSHSDGSSFIYASGTIGDSETAYLCVEGSKLGTRYILGRIYTNIDLENIFHLGQAFLDVRLLR